MILFFLFPYVILTNIENENKQMWFATFNSRARRWCYDRSCFIRNNILTFIWLSCRNYYSICLNYTDYNFKQIDNKKTHLAVQCVFYILIGKPRLWILHFISLLYSKLLKMSNQIQKIYLIRY